MPSVSHPLFCWEGLNQCGGDPGKIRTSDTQFRKLLLYPPELRGHDEAYRSSFRKLPSSLVCTVRVLATGAMGPLD